MHLHRDCGVLHSMGQQPDASRSTMFHQASAPPHLDQDGKPHFCHYSVGLAPSADNGNYIAQFALPAEAAEHYLFSYSAHVGGVAKFGTHHAEAGSTDVRVLVRVAVESLKQGCPVNHVCSMVMDSNPPSCMEVFVRCW